MYSRKVIVFGTFDILHPGHLNFFNQAKKLGDFLVVVVARDKNVLKIKGNLPSDGEQVRLKELKTFNKFRKLFPKYWLRYKENLKNENGNNLLIDKVILGNLKDRYKILQKEKPDIIALGYDQKVNLKILQNKLEQYNIKSVQIVRLKAFQPDIYKSSKLK